MLNTQAPVNIDSLSLENMISMVKNKYEKYTPELLEKVKKYEEAVEVKRKKMKMYYENKKDEIKEKYKENAAINKKILDDNGIVTNKRGRKLGVRKEDLNIIHKLGRPYAKKY